MDDQTNGVERQDILKGLGEDVQNVAAAGYQPLSETGTAPEVHSDVQIETVFRSEGEVPMDEPGGTDNPSQSVLQGYGIWAALLGGVAIAIIVVLRLRAQRQTPAELPSEERRRFRLWTSTPVELPPPTPAFRDRLRGRWNRGDTPVADVSPGRTFIMRRPWQRNGTVEMAEEDVVETGWQRIASRVPRRSRQA